MSINIETDRSFDLDDPKRWMVVERRRTGFSVLFRGTRPECHDYAQEEVQARRDFAMEGR